MIFFSNLERFHPILTYLIAMIYTELMTLFFINSERFHPILSYIICDSTYLGRVNAFFFTNSERFHPTLYIVIIYDSTDLGRDNDFQKYFTLYYHI